MPYTKTKILTYVLTAASAFAQYAPPSPAIPVPGAIDAYLATVDPAFKAWDIGVNERLRSENKSSAGTTHAGSNFDFSAASPTTNSNDYWLTRLMPRVGYNGDLVSFMVEARSSY